MKSHPALKRFLMAAAVLLWLGCSCQLFFTIIMSDFHLDLDFSFQAQMRHWLGIKDAPQLSLTTPMLWTLLAAFLCIGALIIRQIIGEYRHAHDLLTPQWHRVSRILHVTLGFAAAILLALIGAGLEFMQSSSLLAFILSGALVLRLLGYVIQVILHKN